MSGDGIQWEKCPDHPAFEPVKGEHPDCPRCFYIVLQWTVETTLAVCSAQLIASGNMEYVQKFMDERDAR